MLIYMYISCSIGVHNRKFATAGRTHDNRCFVPSWRLFFTRLVPSPLDTKHLLVQDTTITITIIITFIMITIIIAIIIIVGPGSSRYQRFLFLTFPSVSHPFFLAKIARPFGFSNFQRDANINTVLYIYRRTKH